MSPFSLPVLGGAALVSSPALWGALVERTTSTEAALSRYLVSVVVVWAVLGFVAMLIGPAPKPQPVEAPAADADGEPLVAAVDPLAPTV